VYYCSISSQINRGGTGYSDNGTDIDVDSDNNVYAVGHTRSTDFPTFNAFQSVYGGGYDDGVLVKFDSTGTLIYSTYLGGSISDKARGVTVDADKNVYLIGETNSGNFPTVNPIQGTIGGSNDAFVAKFNADGDALIFSTFHGGSSSDFGSDIALDSSNNVYVTGETSSTNFPTVNPYQTDLNTGGPYVVDAFVTKINAAGSAIVYSTYLGGSTKEESNGIAVTAGGEANIVGTTESTDFPTLNALQPNFAGGTDDAFIAKFTSTGDSLIYSTYLGADLYVGSNKDRGNAIDLDNDGYAYVVGETYSNAFPVVDPFQSTTNGNSDCFISKLEPDGSALVYSTYYGGNSIDVCKGAALDTSGSLYVTGYIDSTFLFPTVNPLQSSSAGGADAFIGKIINENLKPIADAGEDQEEHVGETIQLDGSNSTDPDGFYPLSYDWEITDKPSGSLSELSDPAVVDPTFDADKIGDYVISLVVTDSLGLPSDPDEVTITVTNTKPFAYAGEDRIVPRNIVITLDGSGSWDPDGDDLDYAWTVVSKPQGSVTVLYDENMANPYFTPDIKGPYVFELVVTDPWDLSSDPDQVKIRATYLSPMGGMIRKR